MMKVASMVVVTSLAVVCMVAAQQQAPIVQGQPFPGAGSGILTVGGTVNIGNTPTVSAAQAGEWRMAIANSPTVNLPAPHFLRAGVRYEITWPTGEREQITVTSVGLGSWIAVQQSGGARWINADAARAIQELP